jgi:hypothetical protein
MFLDIGAGILFSILIGSIFDVHISSLWIFFGILSSLLPDIDMLMYFTNTKFLKKEVKDHRSFTHFPIVYLPIGIFVYALFGIPTATLFYVTVYFHLIHDTFWLGWGVVWFWPYSSRKFKFFPDKDGKISSQFLLTWTKDEEHYIIKKYHNPHWVRDFYLRPNIVAYVEYSVFLVSILIFFLYLPNL